MTHPQAWPRIAAFLLDYLLILVYLGILALVGLILTLGPLGEAWSALVSTAARKDLLAFFTTVFPVVAYFVWSERSAAGATWGKRKLGLRVVDAQSGRISRGQALIRSVVKFTPWQMAHSALLHIPGFPMAPQDPPTWSVWMLSAMWLLVAVYLIGLSELGGQRTVYDRISSTHVISVAR